MATPYTYQISTPNIDNGEGRVSSAYKDSSGKNKLSTITTTNPTGYKPIDSNSSDPIVKKLSYAVQTDGKITYQYDDGTGNKIRYNSIQEIANDFGISGYSSTTTAKIKDGMRRALSTATEEYNTKNPNTKIGPTAAKPTDEEKTQQASEVEGKDISASISDGYVRPSYGEPKNLRYPEKLD